MPKDADADESLVPAIFHALAHLANSFGGSISFYEKDLDSVGKIDLIIERTDDGVPKYTFTTRPRHPFSTDD